MKKPLVCASRDLCVGLTPDEDFCDIYESSEGRRCRTRCLEDTPEIRKEAKSAREALLKKARLP